MIVWSGKGYLSLLILFLAIFLCISILPETYVTECFIIPLYIAAIFSYVFGIKWNRTLRVFIDKETGKEINFKSNHGIFWLNMEYWGILFPLLALVMLAQNLDKQGTQFYLNVFLVIIGMGCSLFFGINLFNFKASTVSNSQFQKNYQEDATKLSFVKEEIVTNKFENEDHNQYLPK